MDVSDFLTEPVAIATLVLALITAVLATGTFLTIRQNRRFRRSDIERQYKAKVLDAIQSWIEGMLALNHTFEDEPIEIIIQSSQNRIILLSRKEWIIMQAKKIDTMYQTEQGLVNIIERLSFLLEQEYNAYGIKGKTYSKESLFQEVQSKCKDGLNFLNKLRTEEQL